MRVKDFALGAVRASDTMKRGAMASRTYTHSLMPKMSNLFKRRTCFVAGLRRQP
jgi:hypothetical protein